MKKKSIESCRLGKNKKRKIKITFQYVEIFRGRTQDPIVYWKELLKQLFARLMKWTETNVGLIAFYALAKNSWAWFMERFIDPEIRTKTDAFIEWKQKSIRKNIWDERSDWEREIEINQEVQECKRSEVQAYIRLLS